MTRTQYLIRAYSGISTAHVEYLSIGETLYWRTGRNAGEKNEQQKRKTG